MPRTTLPPLSAALRNASALAADQHGQASHVQLARCGIGRDRRRRLVAQGTLIPRWGRVVALGHLAPSALADAMAAVLAGGTGALLSDLAAAALLRDELVMPATIAVTVPRDRRAPDGPLAFRLRRLDQAEHDEHRGIPVTRPERTALDCARLLDEPALVRLTNELVVAHRTSVDRLSAFVAEHPGARGVARLRRVLDAAAEGHARSPAETGLRELLVRAGFRDFRLNHRVLGRERDCVFERQRLVVEVLSGRFHATPAALEADARRSLELQGAGWRPLTVTARMVAEEPLLVVSRIAEARAAR